jgi:hypothetical protein
MMQEMRKREEPQIRARYLDVSNRRDEVIK